MWIALTALAVVLALVIAQYNAIVSLRQMVRNAWSDVDVYLKRRAELIPNLVAAVKGYASHEAAVLEGLAEARSRAIQLNVPNSEKAAAEGQVGERLVKALVLAESYPELKANENFLNLQRELADTEKHLASARQYYNACVRDLNIKIEAFPSSLVAGAMGAKHGEFFELESVAERVAPSVGSGSAPKV
ncbi:MAG: LemA family protein [Fimbriimonadaceae bacterium]|nr:LemA family protein [Fimbriimonadaceae bacterium]